MKTVRAIAKNGKVIMERADFLALMEAAGAEVESVLQVTPRPKRGPRPGTKKKPAAAAASK